MSVQFGVWNVDGQAILSEYLDKVAAIVAPYAPDGCRSYSARNVAMLYGAFHVTAESKRETQVLVSRSGMVMTWDGRLDNRSELIADLKDFPLAGASDADIVSAAYEEWGAGCFRKLLGDWALSVWSPNTRTLVLGKDPIGIRRLYYSLDSAQITWCSIVDPLLLISGRRFLPCEEYIAGWLRFFPAVHLTPYEGIHAVPPSHFVRIKDGVCQAERYWSFDPARSIRYRSDSDYEEHFRTAFAVSVKRRLRSDSPVLGELSGGIDSSSIVCMADDLIAAGAAETPRLDTISYYDDREPNWNERPYFTKIEERRAREGFHINVGLEDPFGPAGDCFSTTPASTQRFRQSREQFGRCLVSQGCRVVLSGIGGDEVTGGIPNPTPELMDLLRRGQLLVLAHQLKTWALEKRKPWFHLFFETARRFLPAEARRHLTSVPWVTPAFANRYQQALAGYPSRVRWSGPSPSFQESQSTLEAVQRQLSCEMPAKDAPFEVRYPYLDRDFLEFLFAIPREQLVRPGERRSLMRRALSGIVPQEILHRKRKAYVARSPIAAILKEREGLAELSLSMISASRGIVDGFGFRRSIEDARRGRVIPAVTFLRTLDIEHWLKGLERTGLLAQKPGSPVPDLQHGTRQQAAQSSAS